MPLTAHMRQSIDDIRNDFYGGGYPDPVSNAEQPSFLFFFYLVEGIDAENKARAFSQADLQEPVRRRLGTEEPAQCRCGQRGARVARRHCQRAPHRSDDSA